MGFFKKLASVGRSIVSGARKVIQKVVSWGAKHAKTVKKAWRRVKPVVDKAVEWVKNRVRRIEPFGLPVGEILVQGAELLWEKLFGERADVPLEQEWGGRLEALAAAIARALDADAVRSDHETYLRLLSAMRIVTTLLKSYTPGDALTDEQVRALHAVNELVERGDEIDEESLEFLEAYARKRFGHSLTVLALLSLNTRYYEELEATREALRESEELEVTYEALLDEIELGTKGDLSAADAQPLLEAAQAESNTLKTRREELSLVAQIMQGLVEFEKTADDPAHSADPYRGIPRVERRIVRRAMELLPRLNQVSGQLDNFTPEERRDLQRFAALHIVKAHEAQQHFWNELGPGSETVDVEINT